MDHHKFRIGLPGPGKLGKRLQVILAGQGGNHILRRLGVAVGLLVTAHPADVVGVALGDVGGRGHRVLKIVLCHRHIVSGVAVTALAGKGGVAPFGASGRSQSFGICVPMEEIPHRLKAKAAADQHHQRPNSNPF